MEKIKSRVYEPREDTFLLQKYIKKYAIKSESCLDIGTGSGILALEAAKYCKKVVAIDINKAAVDYCKKNKKNKKIIFKQSDLFSNVNGKFDLIICNPPYLPSDKKYKDIALDGGKKGFELIERFFSEVNDFLAINGKILIVFSTLTNKNKVEEIIKKNLFVSKLIGQEKLFYESLLVYLIYKNQHLKKFDKLDVKNIKKLTKGHRGIIYIGLKNNKKITIKIQRQDIYAKNTINNEIFQLKRLNKYGIGPKLIDYGKDFFIYGYIQGLFIMDFVEKIKEKWLVLKILKDIFEQMFILDKLKLNKEEMHHPYKHIIINKLHKPILVDFERCKKTSRPKNVTQFCQFIISKKFSDVLKSKNIKINRNEVIRLAKNYRKFMNRKNFNNILKVLSSK